MKPLNRDEVLLIKEYFEKYYLDAKLQKVHVGDACFILEMYKNKKTFYFYISMLANAPMLIDVEKAPVRLVKKNHPVQLFLKTHFANKRLNQIVYDEKFERVLKLQFGYEDSGFIEVRLFPHGQNIIVSALNKKVSYLPIKELKESLNTQHFKARTLEEIRGTLFAKKVSKVVDVEALKEKAIAKKKKAIEVSLAQLEELQKQKWKELGDFLVSHQTMDVGSGLSHLIDKKKTLAENIQAAYTKSKAVKAKLDGLKERIVIFQNELEDLQSGAVTPGLPNAIKHEKKKKDYWKGYRYPLGDRIELLVGKSASDNLAILRHAQAGDLWLHLKDYPGAHGIIRRPKQLDVEDALIFKAARFVATHSKKSAHFLKPGDSFELLVTEVRYVRPIKGDKLGRVQYSNEKVLSVRL